MIRRAGKLSVRPRRAYNQGMSIEMNHTNDIYQSNEQGNQLPELWAKSYFITIHKPENHVP
jgi:hypothetical protein